MRQSAPMCVFCGTAASWSPCGALAFACGSVDMATSRKQARQDFSFSKTKDCQSQNDHTLVFLRLPPWVFTEAQTPSRPRQVARLSR